MMIIINHTAAHAHDRHMLLMKESNLIIVVRVDKYQIFLGNFSDEPELTFSEKI